MMVLFGISFALGFIHLINWIMTKGVIWVTNELFNINWYGKFWVVYVMLILFGVILKSSISIKK